MQKCRVRRTGRPELVFQGKLLFTIAAERVTYELYVTVDKEYVLACEYQFFNINYLRKALRFNTLKELHEYSISNTNVYAINYILTETDV